MKLKITLFLFLSTLFLTKSQAQCDGATFEEKSNIVVIEAETVSLKSSWKKETAKSGYTGSGYITWKGSQNFSTTGVGTLTYKFKINSPGKYRFNWRSRITIIASHDASKEHNDSWLKFPDADDFYGQKGSSKIWPKGSGKTPNPKGQSANGWFKIFMNSLQWQWKAKTSDGDSHDIYVEFDKAGVYTMQVSARSSGHSIDRMVLYKESKYSASSAQSLSRKETKCDGSTPPPPSNDPVVNSFSWINADTDKVIGTLSNGKQINLANFNGDKLTFRANANSETGSVKLVLTGPVAKTRTDNNSPYSVFGDSGSNYAGADLKVGSYTLKATPYDNDNLGGTKGAVKTVNFTVVNNGDDPPPPSGNKVTSFTLVNANTGKDIGTISSGKTFDSSSLPSSLSIRANTSPSSIGKVAMALTGKINFSKNESSAPYYVFGDIGVDPIGKDFPNGSYTIKATPVDGTGLTINFSIGNTSPPPSGNITFTLVRSSDNKDIKSLVNGSIINNGGEKNIRANVSNAGSVSFRLEGATERVWLENAKPYALFGDKSGNYNDGFFKTGSHTLKVTAYSGSNRTGSVIANASISFSVATTSTSKSAISQKIYVYPNPINDDGRFSVKLPEEVQGDMFYTVISSSGAEVEAGKVSVDRAGDNAEFNLDAFNNKNNGVYYLILQSDTARYSVPIVKQ